MERARRRETSANSETNITEGQGNLDLVDLTTLPNP